MKRESDSHQVAFPVGDRVVVGRRVFGGPIWGSVFAVHGEKRWVRTGEPLDDDGRTEIVMHVDQLRRGIHW